MNKFIITFGLAILFTIPFAYSADVVTFNINIKSDLKVTVGAVYQTQKNSFFCKKTVFIDGSLERHQIIKDVVVKEVTGKGLLEVKVPVELHDSCQNKLVGLGVAFRSSSPLIEQLMTIAYQDTEPQDVQKILIGPVLYDNVKYYSANTSSIIMGPKEVANVSVEVVDFDPHQDQK